MIRGSIGSYFLLCLQLLGATTAQKNKPTKPLFPNFVLPSPSSPQYPNQETQPQTLPSGISNPREPPCPDPFNPFQSPPSQYPDQVPPQQLTDSNQALPQVPDLFRKPSGTEKPSIFSKPPSKNAAKPKPEGTSASVPSRLKEEVTTLKPEPTTTLVPARLIEESTTPSPAPPTATEQTTTTEQLNKLVTTTMPAKIPAGTPKKQNELFPRLDRPKMKGGKKIDFKGIPERMYSTPNFIQEPQPIQQQPPYFQPQPQPIQPQPPYFQPPFDNQQSQPPYFQPQYDDQEPQPSDSYLTPPSITYRIAVVADLGNDARVADGRFKSFLKEGNLILQKNKEGPQKYNVTIDLDPNSTPQVFESRLNNDNEGFELSTLNIFNGKLYSCDDETGIVYELIKLPVETNENGAQPERLNTETNSTYVAQPWIILSNEGENSGFRCEWATVKDEHLWIGSTGILVRKTEEESDLDKTRQGVKKVSSTGKVEHLDWTKNYEKISEAIGLPYHKGFAVHEAVAWSDILQRWLFTPRRISKEKYDPIAYGKKGGNTAVFADETFEDFKMEHFGELVETAGFTSIKFIPGTEDQLILALKAGFDTEANALMSTLEVFDIDGNTVSPETPIGKGIYAGVEFI